jgi:hypothetical protein
MYSELFKTVTGGGWTTIGRDVQIKVVDRILYLQCSHGKSDWIQNLKFWHKTYRDVYQCSDVVFKAHAGFTELWLSIKPEIEKLDFDTIVGYSQGAALAVFVHENYYHRKGSFPTTFAFGCPMVLYKPTKALENRFGYFIRVKNVNDIVTLVQGLTPGYTHIGTRYILPVVVINKRPKSCPVWHWLSGHCPDQYRLAIKKAESCAK